LNDEMITQNVFSLPLSLSRIKKPVPISLHGFDIYIHACVLNHFSHECLLQPYGLLPTRLLCPWDSPGKNTGVGCHVLLQRIFPTQGSSPHWQVGSLPLMPPGTPPNHWIAREFPVSTVLNVHSVLDKVYVP